MEVVEPSRSRAEPCYVVIAVDVSGSMERADKATVDARGRRWTLRDEGQLALLQLLPFVYSDLYVGVCHFSDRVRYALPSEETGPVLPWGGNYLSEAACRNLVRPAEFMSSFQTDIAQGMDWALARIQAARRKYGAGPGKVLLLSHGDPRDSSRELAGGGPLISAGARLAEQDVHVYPIIINEASYRPTVEGARLSASERAAEGVMVSLATVTGGRAYRIAPEMGFPDILMDVFGLGIPLAGDLRISPYDWALVVVGPTLEAVQVTPAGQGLNAPVVTWNIDETAESDIRSRTVASVQWPATILRRPEGGDSVERLWKGLWELRPRGGQLDTGIRVYRVPDFLLQLEAEPAFPWWIHQQGQLKARLLDRHGGRRDIQDAGGLSIRVTAQTPDAGGSFAAGDGQWTVPAQLYTSEPFTVQTSGSYSLTCELLYSLDNVNVPLIGLTQDLQIHPPCVAIDVLNATGAALGELSDSSEALSLDAEGGKQVYFRAAARGVFSAEPMSGTLHLAPLSPATWGFGQDANGELATGFVGLPEGEERLTGWADVEVRTPLGIRQFRLPDFGLAYRPAPMRLDCAFGDAGRILWVGELHRQLLTVSAFPVFERFLDQTRELFPETLAGARMRTVDLQSGTAQVTGLHGRLVETPKPSGEKGRTLTATYSLESDIPIPPSDQCEISIEGTISNLQGAVTTYRVIDPVAEGLFTWTVHQEPRSERSEAVSEELYSGEPVRFSAQWHADQNISGVRFEIPRPEPNESFLADLPMVSGTERASMEQTMPPLDSGQTYPVYVHVTRRPSLDVPAVEITLQGGKFQAEDRRLVLEEMRVGTEAASDVVCHAWEPVEIPLRIVFSGYLAGDPRHSAMIEQFKSRCTLKVTSSKDQVHDITSAIEWTSLVPVPAPAGQVTRCTLEGHAPYIPQNPGRAAVELGGMLPKERATQADPNQRAYGHLAVRDPRLAIGVQRLTPGGDEVDVFDSQAWAQRTGALFPVTAGFSTRLRVRIRAAEAVETSPSGPWNIALRVLHRATSNGRWVPESSEDFKLTGRKEHVREVQISKNGQYALEIVGRDAASGQVLTRLTTPVVITIQQHRVVPVVTPPAWITPGVRQWPFEYRVTLRRESGDLSEAPLAFQFQLPGDVSIWLDAIAHVTESETSPSREVLVTSPELLPPLGTLSDGAVRFRLSAQGLELLNWESPNVRVLPPVLERLALGRLRHGREIDVTSGEITWDGSTGLWARPIFRAAPELVGQWGRAKTLLYLWPDGGDTLSGNQVPRPLLQQSEGQSDGNAGASGGGIFTIAGDDSDQGVEILPRRLRWRFWGWPQPAMSQRYGLVASAVYRAQETSTADADGSMSPSADPNRTISEWTPVYTIDLVLPQVIPWCWWVLGAVVTYLVVVAIMRLFARHPDRLGYDMRLAENVATVEPPGLNSPIEIQLWQTPLGTDIELHKRYVVGRWEAIPVAGKLVRGLASVIVPVKVLTRRCLLPRRWAWALITPKTGGNVQYVRQGLLCVWTSPFARKAQAWCSEGGLFDLPADGQVKSITLDLPYRMDGVPRKMRVSVKIRKMAPPGVNRAADGPGDIDLELLI